MTSNPRHRDTPPFAEMDVLWITAGLGCDGDTISMTAATQPSLEDILLGGIPWIPKVNFHNPCLSYENGEAFLKPFHRAVAGELAPFILVIEGSIPNEKNKAEGYWASFGTDQKTGQPILTCDWIDRLAPKAGLSLPPARAPPMAAFMRWRGIRPDAWAFPIIWAGNGNRRRAFLSCAFPDVRCNRIISWRPCFICCTWLQAKRA